MLNNLADNALMLENLPKAGEYLREGLPLSLKIEAAPLTIAGLLVAADLLHRKGETRQAIELVAFTLGMDDLDSENVEAGEKLWNTLRPSMPGEEESLRVQGRYLAAEDGALEKMASRILPLI
jgi:hypothetical protein